ncbi:ribosomal protein S5 domain 2-like protein [Rhizoclosmatium globosum]|uniref:Small ribosomal subunit protein uS9m n=1 Tax=Rhizoclosmatium globosum TaxID=329046 RepID=A0A1Y2BX59_9FUNG|nr:ribosomal protein S5 domain 2-like protein [Rhizoclosmatium globosum]|eukprot:ORY39359.1 ribosomal protein S5 domain 2-like protein [Rhizoclosmatium globosum]
MSVRLRSSVVPRVLRTTPFTFTFSSLSANASQQLVARASAVAATTRVLSTSPQQPQPVQPQPVHSPFADATFFTGNPNYFSLLLRLNTLIRSHNLPIQDKAVYAHITDLPKWMTRAEMTTLKQFRLSDEMYDDLIHKLNVLFSVPEKSDALRLFLQEYVRPGLDLVSAPKAVQTLDEFGRAFARGSRKTATAQAWLVKGSGEVYVNGVHLSEYFREVEDRELVIRPFEIGKALGAYNVWAVVQGGGQSGQASAIAVAVARALAIHEPSLQETFQTMGLTTIDRRQVERKKTGQPKARKKNTWLKR